MRAEVCLAAADASSDRVQRLRWMREARFGLFIHWGLYALPARHEWVRSDEQIPDEAYAAYFEHFDPDLYDPRAGRTPPRGPG